MESNQIILKSAYGKTGGQDYHILPCKDPETGMYPECVRESIINADGTIGQMILSQDDLEKRSKSKGQIVYIPAEVPIVVKHNTVFNLDNPLDKARWEAIKHSKLIAEDRLSRDAKGNYVIDGEQVSLAANGMAKGRYGLADLYVEHPGIVSKTKNDFRKLVAKAVNFVMEDSLDGMVKKCRLLEKDMSHANANDVEDYLLTQAEKYPEKVIDLYTGTDTSNRLLIIDALEKNIVIKREGLLIYADNIVLGGSLDAAVAYLTQPAGLKVKELIMREVYPELYKEAKKTK